MEAEERRLRAHVLEHYEEMAAKVEAVEDPEQRTRLREALETVSREETERQERERQRERERDRDEGLER